MAFGFGRDDQGYAQPQRRVALAPILFAVMVIAMQYLGASKFTSPETGRQVRLGMTAGQEQLLGLQSYQQVLAESQTVDSGPEVEMVRRVVKRLIQGVDTDAQKFEWSVAVLRSNQVNAFCLPGGKIAVYTGILPVARGEGGLATVLGHEIAHATQHHGAQRMFRDRLVQTAMQGFNGSLMDFDPARRQQIMTILGAGAQYGLILPYGREHELEADAIGLRYMRRAGYDPQEAIRFWERMEQLSTNQPPEWVSTHPSHGSRIARLKRLIEEDHG